jgi:hypothetical protein
MNNNEMWPSITRDCGCMIRAQEFRYCAVHGEAFEMLRWLRTLYENNPEVLYRELGYEETQKIWALMAKILGGGA